MNEREARLEAALGQASFCLRQLLPDDADAQFTLGIITAALAQPAVPEPVACWLDPADFETLAEDGWCVVHASRSDPGAEHNADVALYAHPPAQRAMTMPPVYLMTPLAEKPAPTMPEPDFYLDGGEVPCFYASTIRAFLAAQEKGKQDTE